MGAYLNEDAIVDLAQPEQLQDFPGLGMHVIDTPDAHHKRQLGLWFNIEASLCLCFPLQPDQVLFLQTNRASNIRMKLEGHGMLQATPRTARMT